MPQERIEYLCRKNLIARAVQELEEIAEILDFRGPQRKPKGIRPGEQCSPRYRFDLLWRMAPALKSGIQTLQFNGDRFIDLAVRDEIAFVRNLLLVPGDAERIGRELLELAANVVELARLHGFARIAL